MNCYLFLSLFSYLLTETIKWLEQLVAERQGQGVGGEERQEVTGATFGARTWEWLIPKLGELPAKLHMCNTWMGEKRKYRGRLQG